MTPNNNPAAGEQQGLTACQICAGTSVLNNAPCEYCCESVDHDSLVWWLLGAIGVMCVGVAWILSQLI